jgi:hypothetical protein
MKKGESESYKIQLFLVALILVFALAFFLGTTITGNLVFDYTRADCNNPEAWIERCVIEGGFTRQSCNDLANQCEAIRVSSTSESMDSSLDEERRSFMQQVYSLFTRDDGVEQLTIHQENFAEETQIVAGPFSATVTVSTEILRDEAMKKQYELFLGEVTSSLEILNTFYSVYGGEEFFMEEPEGLPVDEESPQEENQKCTPETSYLSLVTYVVDTFPATQSGLDKCEQRLGEASIVNDNEEASSSNMAGYCNPEGDPCKPVYHYSQKPWCREKLDGGLALIGYELGYTETTYKDCFGKGVNELWVKKD